MASLTTVSYTINVNGELTEHFEAKKGLRKGDLISPYLFVVCMEYLSICLKELYNNRQFRFHLRCKRMELINICFADDLLLFTGGDEVSVQILLQAFMKFSAASGLKANQHKSCIYFGGVSEPVKQEILRRSGMSEGQLPFRVQLIKDVLFGVQIYWSQVFVFPQKVLKLLQTACRTFLWTGKSHISRRALVA